MLVGLLVAMLFTPLVSAFDYTGRNVAIHWLRRHNGPSSPCPHAMLGPIFVYPADVAKREPNRFRVALQEAQRDLRVKTKERDQATRRLERLNAEIPRLVATIAALEGQLNPTLPLATTAAVASSAGPAAIGEVDEAMGSIPAATQQAVSGATTPEELPGMTDEGWE